MLREDFYTSLVDALPDLGKRRGMKAEVERWWELHGLNKPPLTERENMAIIARQIASGSYEDILFSLMAEKVGLTPVWCEYTADSFVTVSADKIRYLRYYKISGRGRNGGPKLEKVELYPTRELKNFEGKELRQIMVEGGSLVEHHHALQEAVLPGAIRCDFNEWLQRQYSAFAYYPVYLAMAVAHCVIFEDFHDAKGQNMFFQTVVLPAYKKVAAQFGVKPLIVHLPQAQELNYYPASSDWQACGVDLAVYL